MVLAATDKNLNYGKCLWICAYLYRYVYPQLSAIAKVTLCSEVAHIFIYDLG